MDFSKYYNMKGSEVYEVFRDDALAELGLAENIKTSWMWDMAWKNGHEGGFEEVFSQLSDLKDMLCKDKNETNERLN